MLCLISINASGRFSRRRCFFGHHVWEIGVVKWCCRESFLSRLFSFNIIINIGSVRRLKYTRASYFFCHLLSTRRTITQPVTPYSQRVPYRHSTYSLHHPQSVSHGNKKNSVSINFLRCNFPSHPKCMQKANSIPNSRSFLKSTQHQGRSKAIYILFSLAGKSAREVRALSNILSSKRSS